MGTMMLKVVGLATTPLEGVVNTGGATPQPGSVDLTQNFIITQLAAFQRVYAGAITDDPVDFGTLATAGAKGLIIKCPVGACTVKLLAGLTTGTLQWPLSPPAYLMYMNPAAGFPTSALVTTTAAATVEFLAVG